jgi:hypothetical protein
MVGCSTFAACFPERDVGESGSYLELREAKCR